MPVFFCNATCVLLSMVGISLLAFLLLPPLQYSLLHIVCVSKPELSLKSLPLLLCVSVHEQADGQLQAVRFESGVHDPALLASSSVLLAAQWIGKPELSQDLLLLLLLLLLILLLLLPFSNPHVLKNALMHMCLNFNARML